MNPRDIAFYFIKKFWVLFNNLARIPFSYIEPGRSKFLLKVLISALVGVVIFLRPLWRGVGKFFSTDQTKR
jgi:hypothetical protein